MAALETVQEYVSAARTLLSDTATPYRYSDADLVLALSLAMLEARKVRPDLFLGRYDDIPSFTTNDATEVELDEQYRVAMLYYIVAHAQLRDEEFTQDARAGALLAKFTSQMLSLS